MIIAAGGAMHEPGYIRVWRTDDLEDVANLATELPNVTSLVVSPDARWFVTACQMTDHLEVWDAQQFRLAQKIAIVRKPYRRTRAGLVIDKTHVADMAFSPDSTVLALGCWDTTAKVLALDTGGGMELALPRNRHNVEFVAFAREGQLLCGTYQRLAIWSLSVGLQSQTVELDRADVWQHLFLTGIGRVMSVSQRGAIRLYDVSNWEFEQHAIGVKREPPFCLAWSSELRHVAIALCDGEVLFWDPMKRSVVDTIKAADSSIDAICFSPRGPQICVATSIPTIQLVEHTLAS